MSIEIIEFCFIGDIGLGNFMLFEKGKRKERGMRGGREKGVKKRRKARRLLFLGSRFEFLSFAICCSQWFKLH